MPEAQVGELRVGDGHPMLLIAGPCVLEEQSLALSIAAEIKRICEPRRIQFVFKASFDKANRTSIASYRGPGMQAGLRMLERVKAEVGVPVTTDIHEPAQASVASEVCQMLQIPAFLARQTDLLAAAARTESAIHVKKGQFMAPGDMQFVLQKLVESGAQDVLLCERGTFFGYGRLVNDFRSLVQMRELGAPVVFDATHSVQEPGGQGGTTGGNGNSFPISRVLLLRWELMVYSWRSTPIRTLLRAMDQTCCALTNWRAFSIRSSQFGRLCRTKVVQA